MKLNRTVESDEFSDILSMAMMLYAIPHSATQKTEALVVIPGMDESWRIVQALDLYSGASTSFKHLFVAGVNAEELARHQALLASLKKDYAILRDDDHFHLKLSCVNTKDQAEWICDEIFNLQLSSLTLFVSPYHLLRAYCAVLKSCLRRNLDSLAIIPAPVIISPNARFHKDEYNAWELIPGELKRLLKYQIKGDVATYQELRGYLNNLWASGFLDQS